MTTAQRIAFTVALVFLCWPVWLWLVVTFTRGGDDV
jgi:hypothetical protein